MCGQRIFSFAKLFGDRTLNDLNVSSSDAASASASSPETQEDGKMKMLRIVEEEYLTIYLVITSRWPCLMKIPGRSNRKKPRPIYCEDALPMKPIKQNGNIDWSGSMASHGMRSPRDVWSLVENATLKLFFTKWAKVLCLIHVFKASHG